MNDLTRSELGCLIEQRIIQERMEHWPQHKRLIDQVEALEKRLRELERQRPIPPFCSTAKPEKPKRDYIRTVEQSACAKCGICFVGGELLILRPDRFLEHSTCPPKPEVEGLSEILGEIQTDECNQHMHDEAKRRIVEAVCKVYDQWCRSGAPKSFRDWLKGWGGIAK